MPDLAWQSALYKGKDLCQSDDSIFKEALAISTKSLTWESKQREYVRFLITAWFITLELAEGI